MCPVWRRNPGPVRPDLDTEHIRAVCAVGRADRVHDAHPECAALLDDDEEEEDDGRGPHV